jgi:hypothetical protein
MADEQKPGDPPSSNLTDEQKKRAEFWFQNKASKAVCPICYQRTWTILPDLLAPPTFHGGSMVLGGPSYPHMVLTCTTCGNSQFINAIISGVLEVKT